MNDVGSLRDFGNTVGNIEQTRSDLPHWQIASYALNAAAGGRARTDDLLFTKRRGIFFGICLALTLVIVGHYSAEPDAARSVSIYQIPPYFYVHFYPQIGGAA